MERVATPPDRLALIVVGLGSLGSSIVAGIEAARGNLCHPWGSWVESGGAGRAPSSTSLAPLRQQAPALAPLCDLAVGAFELRDDDAYRAALRAGLVSRSLLDDLRPRLQDIRAMLGARSAPTRRHLADSLAEDMRGFLAHHGASRGVVVCTVPGPRSLSIPPPFTIEELWALLEEKPEQVTPGMVYAAAAAQAGLSFVGAARDPSLCSAGIAELYSQAGVSIAGSGLLSPEGALREALTELCAFEGLDLVGTNALALESGERAGRAWVGAERTQELALASGWAGARLELGLDLRGPLSLHQAGRAYDAALLLDLASQAGRSGTQGWMDALFAAPLSGAAPRTAAAPSLAARRARLLSELPVLQAAIRSRGVVAA